jgi:hypothetical protein
MKQFYISINKTCALNLVWGKEPQSLMKCKKNKWAGLCHLIYIVNYVILTFEIKNYD